MPRFFYTDPLSAAWMARHFGMYFYFRDAEGFWTQEAGFDTFANDIHWSAVYWGASDKRFYIHDNSHHLLDPQPDDVVLMNDLEGANSVEFWREGRNKGKLIRIIERQGDAFHWPASEAA
jgi:hypothetical protein